MADHPITHRVFNRVEPVVEEIHSRVSEERQNLFRHLLQSCRWAAIIETGTCLGSSTDFMAECSMLPVYSVEADARSYGFAKMRLKMHKNVKLSLGDRCFKFARKNES